MPKKILIIDDEKDMRLYLGALFKKAGYEVDSAENGEKGLDAARKFAPDLITLDVLMPKRSGIKAYRDLRTSAETKDIPIVILTGLANQNDFFGGDLGALPSPDAVVEKPIERETFLQKVSSLIL